MVYYGPNGTNKTRTVYEQVDDLDEFYKWEPQNDVHSSPPGVL